MTPARPPFTEGERLMYAPHADTRWPVFVVNPHPWDRWNTLYCRQSRADGAPCDSHGHMVLTCLFREVPA